jgi:hypothetical protein
VYILTSSGDKYDNGVITPKRPHHHRGKSSRPDREINFQRKQSAQQSSLLPQESFHSSHAQQEVHTADSSEIEAMHKSH